MSPAFDALKYIALQKEKILERINQFPNGKLYFEIGGKFLYDGHAERVLPGFDPESKLKILQSFNKDFDIIFCVNSPDIHNKRIWKHGESYQTSALNKLAMIKNKGLPDPKIVINLYREEGETQEFIKKLHQMGYEIFLRYFIEGYPENVDKVLSPEGYGRDQYVSTSSNFVIVISLGSNSGKMSTCLGQIYHDKLKGLDSGYAKYETFPIWNLPLDHPVNLAYEAATADIGDVNLYDPYHLSAYGIKAVNYNRDIEAFPILKQIINRITSDQNYMRKYNSPTDMGINCAKDGIIDESVAVAAATEEIKRRIVRYKEEFQAGTGQAEWIEKCEKLLEEATKYQY